jgi:hypothetical protein
MTPLPRPPRFAASRPTALRVGAAVLLGAVLAGCSTISQGPPSPTPADFPGIAGELTQRGITVDRIVSGDGGCNDTNLAKTAIGFDASGLDQVTPVRLHVYIFRNRATFIRLRSTVDACAAGYASDPATFELVEDSPYVVAGQGPWGKAFKDNIREALTAAAGTGG